jgi:hypothetical protein
MSELRPIGFHEDPRASKEREPEPCEYCSRWNGALQLHDGTCDGITREQWITRPTQQTKEQP